MQQARLTRRGLLGNALAGATAAALVSPGAARASGGVFSVRAYGARGDGTGDDRPAFDAAIQAAFAAGGGTVTVPGGVYALKPAVPAGSPAGSRAIAVDLLPGVSLVGDGSAVTTLVLVSNVPGTQIRVASQLGPENLVVKPVRAGDDLFALQPGHGLVAGDRVAVRLGDNEWDDRETRFATFARVLEATPVSVRLDVRSPIDVVSTSNVANRVIRKVVRLAENQLVKGLALEAGGADGSPGNSEGGVDVRWTKGTRIEDVTALHPGPGIVMGGYAFGLRAVGLTVLACRNRDNHTAKGRVLNLWNANDCVFESVHGQAFEGAWCMFESYCSDIVLRGCSADLPAVRSNPSNVVMLIGQGSAVRAEGFLLEGTGNGSNGKAIVTDSGGTSSTVELRDLRVDIPFDEIRQLPLDDCRGTLQIRSATGTVERYDLDDRIPFVAHQPLAPGLGGATGVTVGPTGLLAHAEITVSAGVLPAGVDTRLRRPGNGSQSLTPGEAGQTRPYPQRIGLDYPVASNETAPLHWAVVTPASGVHYPPNAAAVLRAEFARPLPSSG